MAIQTVRRIAADLLNAGESRIRILDTQRAADALTRDDVRALIKEKLVIALPKRGVSRGKARKKLVKKRAGRGRGQGSKKGALYAGVSRKTLWMRKVRALRKVLRNNSYRLASADYRDLYRMVKGNSFRSKRQLLEMISQRGIKG